MQADAKIHGKCVISASATTGETGRREYSRIMINQEVVDHVLYKCLSSIKYNDYLYKIWINMLALEMAVCKIWNL
jgi:hypothetical protein